MVGWNYRMTEMQSAIGLAESGPDGFLEYAPATAQREILVEALRTSPLIK